MSQPASPAPMQESPRTVGIGCLIVLVMYVVVGAIMHFSEDPVSQPPAKTAAPETSSRGASTPASGASRPSVSAGAPPIYHAHLLPARIAKLHPEFVTDTTTLDKRFSVDERRQLFVRFIQEQRAVQTEIHLDYENLPLAASPEENDQRSAEEGQKVVDAQSNVYDTVEKEYRLTDGQMGSLIEEGRDNHWDQNAAP